MNSQKTSRKRHCSPRTALGTAGAVVSRFSRVLTTSVATMSERTPNIMLNAPSIVAGAAKARPPRSASTGGETSVGGGARCVAAAAKSGGLLVIKDGNDEDLDD